MKEKQNLEDALEEMTALTNGITKSHEIIDQETALRYKESGRGFNLRHLSSWHSNYFKEIILSGAWCGAISTLYFDDEGHMGDGQHRIEGFLLACEDNPELKIDTDIVRGLPKNAFKYIDTGNNRSTHCILKNTIRKNFKASDVSAYTAIMQAANTGRNHRTKLTVDEGFALDDMARDLLAQLSPSHRGFFGGQQFRRAALLSMWKGNPIYVRELYNDLVSLHKDKPLPETLAPIAKTMVEDVWGKEYKYGELSANGKEGRTKTFVRAMYMFDPVNENKTDFTEALTTTYKAKCIELSNQFYYEALNKYHKGK